MTHCGRGQTNATRLQARSGGSQHKLGGQSGWFVGGNLIGITFSMAIIRNVGSLMMNRANLNPYGVLQMVGAGPLAWDVASS